MDALACTSGTIKGTTKQPTWRSLFDRQCRHLRESDRSDLHLFFFLVAMQGVDCCMVIYFYVCICL